MLFRSGGRERERQERAPLPQRDLEQRELEEDARQPGLEGPVAELRVELRDPLDRAGRGNNEDKAEYDTGPNGAKMKRHERDAFERLLDQINYGKGGRRNS